MRKVWAAVVLAMLLVAGCDRGSHPHQIGTPAPEFTVSDGVQTVALSKYRGHTVILNLWATWCPPCLDELPSLIQLQHEMPNIVVIAISEDEDDAVYRHFLVQHHIDFLTVRDPSMRINKLYGTVQIPESYVIDKNGMVRRKFVSAQDWTSPEILGYLKKL
ncbi:MAG TPA: TlpA disulfide reductase family protein [Edaphobacter sp.]|uniref:TlpA family protein disulfide reductase n=1 Tax=Edaphobacter sp. TaxID=1934404 RepID=UPI002B752850|nr:TlpA disulfide reductase family protein [Edaphobacter sp.]HUZ94735.1 TlpA disulfide reductase family protein [Edaphobacter sp.]